MLASRKDFREFSGKFLSAVLAPCWLTFSVPEHHHCGVGVKNVFKPKCSPWWYSEGIPTVRWWPNVAELSVETRRYPTGGASPRPGLSWSIKRLFRLTAIWAEPDTVKITATRKLRRSGFRNNWFAVEIFEYRLRIRYSWFRTNARYEVFSPPTMACSFESIM